MDHHLVCLSDKEIEFLLWCLGRGEGSTTWESEERKKFVLENAEALRIKLMSLE